MFKIKHTILTKAYLESSFDSDCEKIELNFMNIVEIEPGCFENFTKIKILDLNYNDIMNIEELGKITSLTTLYLCSNQVREIKGLEKLTSLKSLGLCNNKIMEIKGLDCLTSLIDLDLENNPIIDDSRVSGYKKLIPDLYIYYQNIRTYTLEEFDKEFKYRTEIHECFFYLGRKIFPCKGEELVLLDRKFKTLICKKCLKVHQMIVE